MRAGRTWRLIAGFIGKVWNLPNTLLGLAYGALGHLVGLAAGTRPSLSLGHNAIQFHNNALMLTAMTLGNVIIYGPCRSPDAPNVCFSDSPACHTVGREEFRHTQQGEILGPLYLPTHLVAGLISLLRAPHPGLARPVDAWHRNNFMERGPMRDRIF
jgi:hypothetical protein